ARVVRRSGIVRERIARAIASHHRDTRWGTSHGLGCVDVGRWLRTDLERLSHGLTAPPKERTNSPREPRSRSRWEGASRSLCQTHKVGWWISAQDGRTASVVCCPLASTLLSPKPLAMAEDMAAVAMQPGA